MCFAPLNPQPSTLNLQPVCNKSCASHPSTLNPQPSTLNPYATNHVLRTYAERYQSVGRNVRLVKKTRSESADAPDVLEKKKTPDVLEQKKNAPDVLEQFAPPELLTRHHLRIEVGG